jgi:uncharacterized membrane protein
MINIKSRVKNLYWWIFVISCIISMAMYFGIDLTKYIGEDWKNFLGIMFTLLNLLGITVDTSTKGIPDFTNDK